MPHIDETITIDAEARRVRAVADDLPGIRMCLPSAASVSSSAPSSARRRAVPPARGDRLGEALRSSWSVLSVDGEDRHAHATWTAEFDAADDAATDGLQRISRRSALTHSRRPARHAPQLWCALAAVFPDARILSRTER
jgi:hypothetical protein